MGKNGDRGFKTPHRPRRNILRSPINATPGRTMGGTVCQASAKLVQAYVDKYV